MSIAKSDRKYKAFISYKHSEIGVRHAVSLERALKRYAKPLLSLPIKIFRDEKHMVPGNDLGKLITGGLEASEFLIFIAEKGAATSPWCQEELEYWCDTLGRKEQLIIVHVNDSIHLNLADKKVDWDKTDALPILLSKYISTIPFYIDLHWARNPQELDLDHARYRGVINLMTAKLRGVSPESLNDEELRVYRRNRRLRNAAIGVLSVLFLLSVITSLIALNMNRKAEASAEVARVNEQLATASAQEARDSARVAQEQRGIAVIARDSMILAQSATISALQREATERQKAERRARANQNAALALQTVRKDPTLALRIAHYNLQNNPDDPSAASAFHEIISDEQNIFYEEKIARQDTKKYVTWSKEEVALLRDFFARKSTVTSGPFEIQANTGQPFAISYYNGELNLVSTDATGRVMILDTANKVRYALDTGERYLTSISYSPIRKAILTGYSRQKAKLWDLEGNLLREYGENPASSVAFSQDGKYVLTGMEDANVVEVWNEEGELIKSFTGPRQADKLTASGVDHINAVALSPNKQFIIRGGQYTSQIWDEQGKEVAVIEANSTCKSIAVSQDNSRLLIGDYPNVSLYSLSGEKLSSLKGNPFSNDYIAFAPDGQKVIAGGSDGFVRVWNLQRNVLQKYAPGNYVRAVAFSSDGKHILTGDYDGFVRLWDRAGPQLGVIEENQFSVDAIACSPNGAYFFTGAYHKVKQWSNTGDLVREYNTDDLDIDQISIAQDGEMFLIMSVHYRFPEVATAVVWNSSRGRKILDLSTLDEDLIMASLAPSGKRIATINNVGIVKIWSINGKLIYQFNTGFKYFAPRILFSPNGRKLLISESNELQLYNLKGELLQIFRGHTGMIRTIAFSPDGKFILSGGNDDMVKVWALNGQEIQTFRGHSSQITSAVFSADGKYILSGSTDGTAQLWLAPEEFLKQSIYQCSLQELYDAGTQLEARDLAKVESGEN